MITFGNIEEAKEYSRDMNYKGFGTKVLHSGNTYKVIITSKPRSSIKFWHGTQIDRVESILEKGLIPGYASPAGQTWSPEHKAIYFYMDKETAIDQAEQSNEYEPNIAVLEIEIPPTEENLERLKLGEEGELIYKGTISPQYIKRIR